MSNVRGTQPAILLLGATGRVGGATLRELMRLPAERQPFLHLLTRRPERLPLPALPHKVHRGGIEDRAALGSAVDSVDSILLVTGDHPAQVELETSVIDAACRSGRPRIVKVSAITAGLSPRISFGRLHGEIEDYLQQSGIDYTILRPTFFFQSLELFAGPVRTAGRLIAPAGNGRIAFIDVGDVGAIAARVLTERSHDGAVYDLTGDSAWPMSAVAAALTATLGRRVTYASPPLLAARLMMKFAGGMDWRLSGLVTELFAAIQSGAEERVASDATVLLGRRPVDLDAYFASSRNFWARPPQQHLAVVDRRGE